MSVIVNCIVCGNPFSAYNRNSDFCGKECEYMYDNEIRRRKRRMEAEKKRRNSNKKKIMSIPEVVAAAEKEGTTYGKYVEKHGL